MEVPGGGQIVMKGTTAFVGHQHGPDGTTILDIADPRQPKVVSKLMVSHPMSHSHKVRVVGDLMVVNSEIEPGKGDRLAYPDGGFRIYDIKDRANPRLLSFTKTYARGVHRFDVDASYAYMSTEMDGFTGNILVIYDIRNPSKPVEVSRWWMPGQNVAAGEPPHPKGRDHSLHHAMRCGNEMYAGCWFSGISIIDVSDIAKPKTLGHHEYDPPHAEPTHTFLKVPFRIDGKSIGAFARMICANHSVLSAIDHCYAVAMYVCDINAVVHPIDHSCLRVFAYMECSDHLSLPCVDDAYSLIPIIHCIYLVCDWIDSNRARNRADWNGVHLAEFFV